MKWEVSLFSRKYAMKVLCRKLSLKVEGWDVGQKLQSKSFLSAVQRNNECGRDLILGTHHLRAVQPVAIVLRP